MYFIMWFSFLYGIEGDDKIWNGIKYRRGYSPDLRCSGLVLWLYADRKSTTGVRSGCVHVAFYLRLPTRLWYRCLLII